VSIIATSNVVLQEKHSAALFQEDSRDLAVFENACNSSYTGFSGE
jgi:hypothetical protein